MIFLHKLGKKKVFPHSNFAFPPSPFLIPSFLLFPSPSLPILFSFTSHFTFLFLFPLAFPSCSIPSPSLFPSFPLSLHFFPSPSLLPNLIFFPNSLILFPQGGRDLYTSLFETYIIHGSARYLKNIANPLK